MMSDPAKLFRTVTNFTIFDNNLIGHAREVFDDYIEKGIILSYDFDHHKWETTNEYANVTFLFNVNTFQYKRFYQPFFGIDYEGFIAYLKSFIVLSMDQHVLGSLQAFLRDIKRMIKETKRDILSDIEVIKISSPSLCIDFLASLPYPDDSEVSQLLEQLDNAMTIVYQNKPKQQRQLAQFQSYFAFNDILADYWGQDLSQEQRLF